MLDKILFAIQWFFVKIKVVKTQGKTNSGKYRAVGVNRKNPLSYPIVFIFALFCGLIAFFKEFYDMFKISFKN